MPMKLGLKSMAVVSTNGVDREGKLGYHVLDESDGGLLGVSPIDVHRSDTGGIVHRGFHCA